MPILTINRENYQEDFYLPYILHRIWNNPNAILKWNIGCSSSSTAMINTEFEAVYSAYGRIPRIKANCLSIEFVNGEHVEEVATAITQICSYIGQSHQIIAVLAYNNENLQADLVFNSVSYRDGHKFHDNNMAIHNLRKELQAFMPGNWTLHVSKNSCFNGAINTAEQFINICT